MRGYNKNNIYMLLAGPLSPTLSPATARHPHLYIFKAEGDRSGEREIFENMTQSPLGERKREFSGLG
jgi:hypothetical protein